MEQPKGNQHPTRSVVLPYKKTKRMEAVGLYEKTGRKAQEWQRTSVKDIMDVNPDGLWTHMKFGYSIPRRSGKTELEKIELLDEIDGCIHYRTRLSKGGLGEGFDLLIVDEAQKYTDDQDTALKYVVSCSPRRRG